MNGKKKGFTLIELLVVVLIIGILAAIALPQYQKAVLKSRYTTLMPIAKGIAEGNEAYFMEHGTYADDPTELPIKGQQSYPDGTELRVVDDTDKDVSYVIATRPKLMPNNKYIVFQKHSGKFSDVTLCEATSDPLATWLCKDALKGQVVEGNSLSGTGWTSYALSGDTTGSSFSTALEQVAEGLKAQNTNYEIASVDEENGKVTLCDTSVATIANGQCKPTEIMYNTNTDSYDPYEITYDEDGETILTKKVCYEGGGGDCISTWFFTYEDDGSYKKSDIMCDSDYSMQGNGQCSGGNVHTQDYFHDATGTLTLEAQCIDNTTILPCSVYRYGYYYPASGNSMRIDCSSDNVSADGQCQNGYWYIGSYYCEGGEVVDWGNGKSVPTCKVPSAS